MLTFIKNEKGREEAQIGYHDDLIMGLAISYYIKSQIQLDESVIVPKAVFHFETEEPAKDDFGSSMEFI